MSHKKRKKEEKTYFQINEERVNRQVCLILRWMTMLFPVLYFANELGLFSLAASDLVIMGLFGCFCTLSPSILLHFHVNSVFQKYYNLIAIMAIVLVMAQNANLNLSLAFLLPLVLACLYFDPFLTCNIAILGYISMLTAIWIRAPKAIGLFINLVSKEEWFRKIAGRLSLEYLLLVILLIIVSIRSRKHIKSEQQLQLRLKEEKERYRAALSSSMDLIFEYDIQKDFISLYGSFSDPKASKSEPNIIGQFKTYLMNLMKDYPEDVEKALHFLSGEDLKNIEVRMPKLNGKSKRPVWLLIEASAIYEKGLPVKLIGKMRDISTEKMHEQEIIQTSQMDHITKLYLPNVAKSLIEAYLFEKPGMEPAALLVVYVHNFKDINDAYGSIFGKTVLEQVAEVLKSEILKDNVMYRLEGVKFAVLLKNTNLAEAKQMADKLCKAAEQVYIGENKELSLCFSIGFTTTSKSNYLEQLFLWAYKALYVVVNSGGGFYLQYTEETCNGADLVNWKLPDLIEEDAGIIEPEKDIAAYCFAILERTKDTKSAVNLLLSRIGKYYHLLGIDIVKTDTGLLSNLFLYQWSEGLYYDNKPKASKQQFTETEFDLWVKRFDENGIQILNSAYFDCIDETMQKRLRKNLPSQLQCAIYEEGEMKGAVIFSNEDPAYVWPEKMKYELREISRIIAWRL